MFGVDYATRTTNPRALKNAGVKFACRYLSVPGNPKNLERLEATLLRGAGIHIVTVFETTADRALAGKTAGEYDAHRAEEQLVGAGGAGAPVYFAVDFDVTGAQQPLVNSYLRGAASVLGTHRTGVYGGVRAVSRALDAGVCRYGWQTYAWSAGRWDKRTHIRQYSNGHSLAGLNVDYDAAMKTDFGQWDKPKIPVPKLKPRYAVHALGDKGQLEFAFTSRYPAASLAKWGVSRHNPASIEIKRVK